MAARSRFMSLKDIDIKAKPIGFALYFRVLRAKLSLMKKALFLIVFLVYVAGLFYLSLPDPKAQSLPESLRSTEPGDTWQHPEQSAYFTDWTREQVTKFYEDTFALRFKDFTLPSYRLNYPPEESSLYVREHILTYYLEEINHPLRESLFVSGWNPRLSPISNYRFDVEKARWEIIVDGREYQSKVTLKPYYSPVWVRFLIWTTIFPLTFLVITQFTGSLRELYSALRFTSK